MTTEYEPKLLVGAFSRTLFIEMEGSLDNNTFEDVEELEVLLQDCYGMYKGDCDFVGLPIKPFQRQEDLITSFTERAVEFKALTGVEPAMKACVFSY